MIRMTFHIDSPAAPPYSAEHEQAASLSGPMRSLQVAALCGC